MSERSPDDTDQTDRSDRRREVNDEYGTVACDSCDIEVVRDEARRFVMFEPDGETTRYTGWTCDSCVDDGPIGFPDDPERATGAFTSWIADGDTSLTDRAVDLVVWGTIAAMLIDMQMGVIG